MTRHGGREMNVRALLLLLGACAVAPPAFAQQTSDTFVAGLATALEGVGQAVGDSALGGPSVFVTATGHAPYAASQVAWYQTEVTAHGATASEAASLRDGRVAAIEALGHRHAVTVEVGSSSFMLQNDGVTQTRNRIGMVGVAAPPLNVAPAEAGQASPAATPAKKSFVARTAVKFAAADPARLPAFLDAASGAGLDNLSGGPPAPQALGFYQNPNSEIFGIGRVEKVDDATWDKASQAAIVEARRQAAVLATAAGRSLSEARQIMSLTRSVAGGEASVTVAVRFALERLAPR